ncbi:hypothetical protein F0160_22485 [Paraburkholderia sp. JPY303]|uniref:hypothetical protein n=1 Tax=Paraburkholderia atlantica TaxID=2654982 RepID=UPI00159231F0|nr:hypothetical protein [Paraburkholderia atlantica]NUY33256.1 hypothetical protein [Paraburkholderia atlantica]
MSTRDELSDEQRELARFKDWWERRGPEAVNMAWTEDACWFAWRASAAAQADTAPTFVAWATMEGLISESHGVRFVNSQCDVAQKAWDAALAAGGAVQEPAAIVRDNPDDIGTIIEATRPLEVGTKLYAGPLPREAATVTRAEHETAVETLRHVIDCLRKTGSYTDEEGEATDYLEPLLSAAPQAAATVPLTGETWYVKIRDACTLSTFEVVEVSAGTVLVKNPGSYHTNRFEIGDLRFVERVLAASGDQS